MIFLVYKTNMVAIFITTFDATNAFFLTTYDAINAFFQTTFDAINVIFLMTFDATNAFFPTTFDKVHPCDKHQQALPVDVALPIFYTTFATAKNE